MKMKNVKIIFFLIITVFLSGCVGNVDLRQQAKENEKQEQKVSSFENTVESGEELENPVAENQEPIKLLFVGDMMFDRHIREAVAKYGKGDYGYILELVKESLSQYDLVIGNLEGPITNKKSVSVNTKMDESKNFVFTFDPAVAKVLFENNIRLVSLGNNHILNQGAGGIEQTKKYLGEAGVDYFDPGETRSFHGISFVGYNYSADNSENQVLEEIKLAKEQSDIIIVCPHWGTEYKVGDPGQKIKELARKFIDAGADAVIGTHPHVVQSSEEYNGKKIYYSLGNFVFDQYFQKETMEGLGVEMTVNPDGGVEYGELKFEMTKRGQTKVEL
ncbi:MAG: hypothetical protein A3J76_03720 [Candidatus Moranbacteria bacterium RBG_13_45_13]|nr:MAG: hypothetical protein A3J76_03720 [Candidatus Moranbacteria bacterium RBG_13_45_13]